MKTISKFMWKSNVAQDMVVSNLSKEMIEAVKKDISANKPFEQKIWQTELVFTLQQWTDFIDPSYKQITHAHVITKRNKETNKLFNKIELLIGTTMRIEWDFSYNRINRGDDQWLEDDEIDVPTLLFCREVNDGKIHYYAIGEPVEIDDEED